MKVVYSNFRRTFLIMLGCLLLLTACNSNQEKEQVDEQKSHLNKRMQRQRQLGRIRM